jgi:prepilin-type N-terminal cleavage/methylation domain-containing protein
MKRKQQKKKRAVTLIEMIVVMLLIATITGALAYNYKASLEKGKTFKTKEGISRIKTILQLELVDNPEAKADNMINTWPEIVKNSPLAGSDLTKDGWGDPYHVSYNSATGDFEVTSDHVK